MHKDVGVVMQDPLTCVLTIYSGENELEALQTSTACIMVSGNFSCAMPLLPTIVLFKSLPRQIIMSMRKIRMIPQRLQLAAGR